MIHNELSSTVSSNNTKQQLLILFMSSAFCLPECLCRSSPHSCVEIQIQWIQKTSHTSQATFTTKRRRKWFAHVDSSATYGPWTGCSLTLSYNRWFNIVIIAINKQGYFKDLYNKCYRPATSKRDTEHRLFLLVVYSQVISCGVHPSPPAGRGFSRCTPQSSSSPGDRSPGGPINETNCVYSSEN